MSQSLKAWLGSSWRWGLLLIASICLLAAILNLAAAFAPLGIPDIGASADNTIKFIAVAIVCLALVGTGGLSRFTGAGLSLEFATEANNSALAIKKLEDEIATIRAMLPGETRAAMNSIEEAQTSDFVTRMLNSARIAYPDDPNKGRFGLKSQRDGYVLEASFHFNRYDDPVVKVSITVRGTVEPLLAKVRLYLHEPSFKHNWIVSLMPKNGIAQLDLLIQGGFTVGAWIEGTETLLELDLAKVPGAPGVVRTL